MNADAFESLPRRVLVPTLSLGNVVVMNSLSSHRRTRVQQPIEATCTTLLYLSPSSPDLDPIEDSFSKLKRLLRSARHRTSEEL